MHSAYIEHKDFHDFQTGFTLDFGSRQLHVFIWKTTAGLHRNTFFHGDYFGAYVPYPYRRARTGLFGEIHLVQKEITPGYVAHEIQHFLYDWLQTQSQTSGTNEKMATLAGEVTRKFWKEYDRSTTRE